MTTPDPNAPTQTDESQANGLREKIERMFLAEEPTPDRFTLEGWIQDAIRAAREAGFAEAKKESEEFKADVSRFINYALGKLMTQRLKTGGDEGQYLQGKKDAFRIILAEFFNRPEFKKMVRGGENGRQQ